MVLSHRQRVLFRVVLVGGIAVLVTYAHGFLTHPEIRWDIWGGVPASLRPLYTASMCAAAAGFFPFTLFILLRLESSHARLGADLGYGVFVPLYLLVLAGSAAWMPLTYWMIEAPSRGVWLAVLTALGLVAAASLGLLLVLLRVDQRQPVGWYRLSVAGCLLFCWQTVVLDAVVWPYFFPL